MKEYQSKSGLHEETHCCSDFYTFSQSDVVHSENEADPLLSYDLFVSSTASATSTIENGKLELDYYLKDKVLLRTHDSDILTWWKENGIKYPALRDIARDILAIPVSAIASEFAFRVEEKILGPLCSKIPITYEAMMCAKDWLEAEQKQS